MQLRAPLWLFSQTKVEAPWWLFSFFSNLHQYDFSLEQNGKFIGRNVIMVLTFFFSESYRGSRGLPLVFLDCFMYLFHFRISGVATYEPSLGPFFGSKEKKPLNPHISKSLLAPIWLSPRTLQHWILRDRKNELKILISLSTGTAFADVRSPLNDSVTGRSEVDESFARSGH